jgi:hypothetical protein
VTRSCGVLLLATLRLAVAQQPPPAAPGESPFRAVPPARSDALQFDRRLPAFEAKDIAGRIWRADDLRGKFTLAYIWHSFDARAVDQLEGPRREVVRKIADLPDFKELERFHEKAKGSKNLQVLSFCIDYDYTHAPEYMKTTRYTFPVIADFKLIESLFGEDGRTGRFLVIDPDLRISAPARSWTFGRLLYELEAAAGR